jgi:hypothetical protein
MAAELTRSRGQKNEPMKTIVLIEKGDLPIQIKKQLMREGYLPLEVKDPSKVRMLAASELGINGDMMTMAALEAMAGPYSSDVRAKFTERLHAKLKDKEQDLRDHDRLAESA